ncbi:TIGR03364 family FAD-dependent oxidoreductase [Corynebacterium guangdongense]|uniref:FAD dependent oxidoreductase TIGR03364 n=1 Tax=Corynebacterium guangdongense TaxID=1783348 RepID=A0ABU1ZYJ6_9CORY|nr:TIGR03364 family FAD-dependent oxidoreductase [Corynebacterium guangdongense]MDR7330000.1 FAD dependent oxidoreductase TIGR03364 [Corynebacterium guangdongense]WJZ18558.1 D-amino acid dehydrogenase small subunit [Corynebacterium guangdongense]
MDTSPDLIVVGSGIIGLATAFLAHEQGQSVHVIDAADRVVGSSVQNFGHACFTAQADGIQDVADVSRAGWLRAAAAAGFWAATSGTWLPAATEVEMQVLREFAEHRGPERVRLVGRDELADALGNPGLEAVGGAHLPRDMRVDPREAAPALARWLADRGVRFTWNTQVHSAADGIVETTRGRFRAGRVVVCPGFSLMQIFPDLAERHQVRVCDLAMALIERPAAVRPEVAVLTGTSMARYDGIAAMPSVPALRRELAEREPDLVGCIANLMATGNDRGLFIGDSHGYSLSPEPFVDAATADLLLGKGGALFGVESPRVLERWQGRYADSPVTNLVLEQVDERTTVAVVTSGIGMTLAFGVADVALSRETVPGF